MIEDNIIFKLLKRLHTKPDWNCNGKHEKSPKSNIDIFGSRFPFFILDTAVYFKCNRFIRNIKKRFLSML